MVVAGWYDDPTRAGRRRYWDGEGWTSYVSDGGPTANDPVPIPAPPPPGPPPARPPRGPACTRGPRSAAPASAWRRSAGS